MSKNNNLFNWFLETIRVSGVNVDNLDGIYINYGEVDLMYSKPAGLIDIRKSGGGSTDSILQISIKKDGVSTKIIENNRIIAIKEESINDINYITFNEKNIYSNRKLNNGLNIISRSSYKRLFPEKTFVFDDGKLIVTAIDTEFNELFDLSKESFIEKYLYDYQDDEFFSRQIRKDDINILFDILNNLNQEKTFLIEKRIADIKGLVKEKGVIEKVFYKDDEEIKDYNQSQRI